MGVGGVVCVGIGAGSARAGSRGSASDGFVHISLNIPKP